MRARHWYTIFGSMFVLFVWTISDPDLGFITNMPYGASTVASLIILTKAILYITLLHYSRKALFDYLDLKEYFLIAKRDSVASATALVAVAIFTLAIAIVIYAGTIA